MFPERILWLSLCVVLVAVSFPIQAQQPKKVYRIGYVSGSGDANNPDFFVEAFKRGLKDLGYVEGKNIVFEYRGAEGKQDPIPP